ncbi:sigma-70 family RNA polymerase sigma factor [Kineococcus sp. SYSU DK005]|uniref:sigma-70 family RNA polymerase sigma factor n=1 Tax=Kineococcus sp. SYSU DK005 TaxID=3383126 RepID=UPI003D7EFECD
MAAGHATARLPAEHRPTDPEGRGRRTSPAERSGGEEGAGAEDLLQDTLERTYLHWRRVSEPSAYARTVVARAVTDRWRRLGRRPREVPLDALWPDRASQQPGHLSARAELAGTGGPDAPTRYAEQDEAVTALRRLSPRQRAVLVLRYHEDWSEAQIADALNCSTGTVKTQASRGASRAAHGRGAFGVRSRTGEPHHCYDDHQVTADVVARTTTAPR